MKQIQSKYEAPKVELIEMELQGILCSSAAPEVKGTGLRLRDNYLESDVWI